MPQNETCLSFSSDVDPEYSCGQPNNLLISIGFIRGFGRRSQIREAQAG
jgi:hypothetical protein